MDVIPQRTLGVLLLVLGAAEASAAPCPRRSSWPTTEWPRQLVDPATKGAQVKALEDLLFTLVGKDEERRGLRTNSLIIVKGGSIIYERYARGFDETKRHITWSVVKSITSSLAGMAMHQGALSPTDSICTYLTEYTGDVCRITLKHLLTFSSGLAWQELYEKDPYQLSSEISLLFGVGHRDQLAHILSHRIAAAPGEVWSYSSGDAQAASAVVKRALVKKFGDSDAFWTLLFNKIGMPGMVIEEDVKGTPMGGSMAFATPRELAKFGWFSLNDGCWAGERLLPEGWMEMVTTPSEAFRDHAPANRKTPSGWSWWLNRPIPSRGLPKPWPDAPDDTYLADGHWGQAIYVIPSADVVIVRTGDDRESGPEDNEFLTLALEVAR